MLSRSSQRALAFASSLARSVSTSCHAMESETLSNDEFRQTVAKRLNMDKLPSPSDFLGNPVVGPEGSLPSKITLSFTMPHQVVMKDEQVDLALVPAESGDFGVMPGHVPTIAQLRPGVLAIHRELDTNVEKWFVSGGFAVAHQDSTVDVTVVEAAKLDDLDPSAVKAGLAEYTARLANAAGKDDLEAAIAQVGIEVYSAMDAALQ